MNIPKQAKKRNGEQQRIVDALQQDWELLDKDAIARNMLRRWHEQHREFPAYDGPAALATACGLDHPQDDETTDQVFAVLLAYATDRTREGSDLATRILLQLMLPKVGCLADALRVDIPEPAERLAYALAAMTEAIRTLDLARCTRAVVLCLNRHAGHLLRQQTGQLRRARQAEIPVDIANEPCLQDQVCDEPDPELLEFLVWCVRTKRITREQAQLFAYSTAHGNIAAARKYGIRPVRVSKKRVIIKRKLREAAVDFEPGIPFTYRSE